MQAKENNYKIGLFGLIAIGTGTMIGSGWLFSSFYAAKIAGLGAYLAWIITACIITVLGLSLAEIASIYPKRGLMARLLVISHNKEFAFVCTITTWLGLTAVIATEAEGSVQYLSSLSSKLQPYLFSLHSAQLTGIGILLAVSLVFLFGIINYWGVRVLSRSNNVLIIAKIAIPTITAIAIMISAFHPHNFIRPHGGLLPNGVCSIFLAMIGAGMIYSFNGFQNIVSFASETKNPARNIPCAMVVSVVLTLGVYVLLESAFIGSLSPRTLIEGWSSLNFTSPFVQITMMLNLNFITIVLYVDSVASPSVTGLIYTGSTTRLLTGMAQDRQMPAFFTKKCLYNFSRRSLLATIILAIAFLLLFRSWESLVCLLSLFYVISYMSIPICLGKLRRHRITGRFSLFMAPLLSPLLFIFLSILFMFSGSPITGYVTVFVAVTFIIYLLTQHGAYGNFKKIIQYGTPLLLHIAALSFISEFGPARLGGNGYLGAKAFIMLVVCVAIISYVVCVFCYDTPPKKPSCYLPKS